MENIVEMLLTECHFFNIENFAANGHIKKTETDDPIKKEQKQELVINGCLHKQKYR